MAEIGQLKTAMFGGFDKKDVLDYIDATNMKMRILEEELKGKDALIEEARKAGFLGGKTE